MRRRSKQICHKPIADACRENPGEWHKAGTYRARYTAVSTARAVRVAYLAAYRPAGAFDAEVRIGPGGDPALWVRFLGPQAGGAR